ncbi:MAG: nicotinate phosphoribosyltransferase [Gammaproteobacteria bacterium]
MISPLLTDFYQLTMAQGYWQLGKSEQEAVFQLGFRKNPFQGNYVIACGLNSIIDFLSHYRFSGEDLNYLGNLLDPQRKRVFSNEFLDYLAKLDFRCDIAAIPEGTLVFPQEPLVRICGPLLQCQLIETPLLNFINFASLIATKASRVCQAAQGDPVMEFGLRRAQGPDGGLTATRSSYIGGCESTSNVLAGKLFNIPVKGTHAHSWVMSYPDELTAFAAFAQTSDNIILLVDTYDTLQGVQHAIQIGKQLQTEGRKLRGIRLDSGDLAKLSHQARQMLDAAGLKDTQIVASGDLEENKIAQLKTQRAPIDAWGVGTRLVTAYDQPSLDAIYKLSAIRDEKGVWNYKAKISDQADKTTIPGIQQVRRYYKENKFVRDVIYDIELGMENDPSVSKVDWQDLLVPIFKQGQQVYHSPPLQKIREFCQQQLQYFTAGHHVTYSVMLEPRLSKIIEQSIRIQ